MSDRQEGWAVPVRPPLLAALGILLFLAVALSAGGWLYRTRFAAATRPPAIVFPAPRLEIVRSLPGEPHRAVAAAPPPGIRRAMAESVRDGDALWAAER